MKYLRIATNRRTGNEIRRDEISLEGTELEIEKRRYTNNTLTNQELIDRWNKQSITSNTPIQWSYSIIS